MNEAAKRPYAATCNYTDSSERILMAGKPIFAEKDKSELSPKEGNYLAKVDLISYFCSIR